MEASSERAGISLGPRHVPVPTSVSREAQAVLARGPLAQSRPYPAPDDHAGWHARVAEDNQAVIDKFTPVFSSVDVDVQEITCNGVRVYVITPPGLAPDDDRVLLEVHGGAFVTGAGECARLLGVGNAMRRGLRTWAVGYRMPPDHPYPVPLDDCLAVYSELIDTHDAKRIVVSGGSAGGNLAAAMLLRARDEGLPLPAAALLPTPQVDLTESGDTFHTNLGLDNILVECPTAAHLLYANGHDLTDPYLSPLFGDFSAGFPPAIITSGTRDLFLSNAVLLHRALRRAGVPAELHVLEAGGHAGHLSMAPEDAELDADVRRFIAEHCPPRGR